MRAIKCSIILKPSKTKHLRLLKTLFLHPKMNVMLFIAVTFFNRLCIPSYISYDIVTNLVINLSLETNPEFPKIL